MEGHTTIYDSVDIEHQSDALDYMCKKWEKEDLLSITWIKTDDDGFHHFEIVLRSAKKSKSD
jgi:hypothetical protein